MRLPKSIKNTNTKASKTAGGLNNRTAIGIDISQHAIKMVQLAGRSLNQIQLENCLKMSSKATRYKIMTSL